VHCATQQSRFCQIILKFVITGLDLFKILFFCIVIKHYRTCWILQEFNKNIRKEYLIPEGVSDSGRSSWFQKEFLIPEGVSDSGRSIWFRKEYLIPEGVSDSGKSIWFRKEYLIPEGVSDFRRSTLIKFQKAFPFKLYYEPEQPSSIKIVIMVA